MNKKIHCGKRTDIENYCSRVKLLMPKYIDELDTVSLSDVCRWILSDLNG